MNECRSQVSNSVKQNWLRPTNRIRWLNWTYLLYSTNNLLYFSSVDVINIPKKSSKKSKILGNLFCLLEVLTTQWLLVICRELGENNNSAVLKNNSFYQNYPMKDAILKIRTSTLPAYEYLNQMNLNQDTIMFSPISYRIDCL